MARGKRDGVNRSQLIRDLVGSNPGLTTREIVNELAKKGHKVSLNLAYLVRSKMGRKRRKERREKAAAAGRQMGVLNPVQFILKVKALANEAGGLKQLKQLVDVLSE